MISFLTVRHQFIIHNKIIDDESFLRMHKAYLQKHGLDIEVEMNRITAKTRFFKLYENIDFRGISKIVLEISIHENKIVFRYLISINNMYIFFILLSFLVTVFPEFWSGSDSIIDSIPSFIFLCLFLTTALYFIKEYVCKKIARILFYRILKQVANV